MFAHITYINHFTKETYKLSVELKAGENAVEVAWGRGYRIMEAMRGWLNTDVGVKVA